MEFVAYPHIQPVMLRVLRNAEQSVVGTAYCFDSTEGIRILEDRRRNHNVSIRVLLDAGQYAEPSAGRQPGAIEQMLHCGVEFRTYKPDRGKSAIMHAKTWAVDGSVAITGSANFTNNGMLNSEEAIVVIRHPGYITSYLEWFEQLWGQGDPVTRGAPEEFLAARAARYAARFPGPG